MNVVGIAIQGVHLKVYSSDTRSGGVPNRQSLKKPIENPRATLSVPAIAKNFNYQDSWKLSFRQRRISKSVIASEITTYHGNTTTKQNRILKTKFISPILYSIKNHYYYRKTGLTSESGVKRVTCNFVLYN